VSVERRRPIFCVTSRRKCPLRGLSVTRDWTLGRRSTVAAAPPRNILLSVFDHLGRPSAEAFETMKICMLVNQHWSAIVRSLICDFSLLYRFSAKRPLSKAAAIRPTYRALTHTLEYGADAVYSLSNLSAAALQPGLMLPNVTRIFFTLRRCRSSRVRHCHRDLCCPQPCSVSLRMDGLSSPL
jgi:hypothetical protein